MPFTHPHMLYTPRSAASAAASDADREEPVWVNTDRKDRQREKEASIARKRAAADHAVIYAIAAANLANEAIADADAAAYRARYLQLFQKATHPLAPL
jgi:hypothetical protein